MDIAKIFKGNVCFFVDKLIPDKRLEKIDIRQ